MRYFFDICIFDRMIVLCIFDVVEDMFDMQFCEVKKFFMLCGKIVVNFFFEDFICMCILFEVVVKCFLVDVINFVVKGFSVLKGESLKDMVQMFEVIGVDVVVVRYLGFGVLQIFVISGWILVGVVNVGDGMYEYLIQVLFDVFMICKCCFGGDSCGCDLSGMWVVIVGDVLYLCVVCFNVWLFVMFGVEVILVVLLILVLQNVLFWLVCVVYDFDEVLVEELDVVMMLCIQFECMNVVYFLIEWEYFWWWGLDVWCVVGFLVGSIVMYFGFMNWGLEIFLEVVDFFCLMVLEQVMNGVFVCMVVLYLLLVGE